SNPGLDAMARRQGLPVTGLRGLAEVTERMRSACAEATDDRTLLGAAMRGMLLDLVPHSAYLTPNEFDDLQVRARGEFGGVGMDGTMEHGFVTVVTPLDDTPASRAGIQASDLILKIDDTFVKGMTLNEAVELLRGEIGTDVELSVMREGEDKPRTVTLTRDRIRIQSVRSERLEDSYGYVRVTQFQNNTGRDVQRAIERIR